jgi:hypothetical protein
MEATKELVGELLLGLEAASAKIFIFFEELVLVLKKCKHISLSIWNNMTIFRYL